MNYFLRCHAQMFGVLDKQAPYAVWQTFRSVGIVKQYSCHLEGSNRFGGLITFYRRVIF
ncbi:MAG: hypothetical protein HY912_01700 [Desulfomonile tiedjei]|uniref:Uncharacterized protein n=1 Tax=Desulfomonile tiedjei TaxID=2358 RepID=A0A9D6UXL6_9BACT|nr:hypothetical protein [Desulfomonile tiedjei]